MSVMQSEKRKPDLPILWTAEDVAQYLQVHKSSVYKAVQKRLLPAVQFLDTWRFFPDDVEKHLRSLAISLEEKLAEECEEDEDA